ncbi:MAG: YCF48-related protein [Azonexus sp.]
MGQKSADRSMGIGDVMNAVIGQKALSVLPKEGKKLRGRASAVVVSVLPWLIIGGLLWAGLFIKPQPVGATVMPPVMERRDHYYGLAIVPGQGRLLAGSSGKIVRIDANDQIELLASATEQTLQDIAVWDSKHGVAVGNEGVVLRTTDGGNTWQDVQDVPRSPIANKLNRVRVAPDGLAVTAGEMGALLITRDYGEHWARLRPETDLAWNDVALLPNGRLLVVGEFGRIALSKDSGVTWEDIKTPVEVSLMSVAFSDGQDGIAVGLEGVVLMTRDGGMSWRPLELSLHDHLYDIAWDAAGKRWIGAGALGRWLLVAADGKAETGRLDARDLSWHVRAVPEGDSVWFSGANVGRWNGTTWHPLGEAWQPKVLVGLPVTSEKSK